MAEIELHVLRGQCFNRHIATVGLDMMYAQSKNNNAPAHHNVTRILA
jgi:hypothetical protein